MSKETKNERTGSEFGIEFIFKNLYPRLLQFSLDLIKNDDLAEDLVQEAFINYWNQSSSIKQDYEIIKSFLYKSVKNAALNHFRHEKVVDRYHRYQSTDETENCVLDAIIRTEILGELNAAIQSLPMSCKQISEMSYLEEMKNGEIADQLRISINTVKTQKQRAIKSLRNILRPQF
ncbi:RNA polymerase sigma-70 factor [Arcticibacter svalbardensis]|uniref:RNA polymerase sigma-70 factor n=1 Tax=Arcticibacter svalbardensis TaxID=1288027 RepID=UPI00059080B3|nr:RNA polymerase sigma-70 factor [Arcticibacter svalbardensis]